MILNILITVEVCESIMLPANAISNTTITVVGTVVAITCIKGHEVIGSNLSTHIIECDTGTQMWSDNPQDCER